MDWFVSAWHEERNLRHYRGGQSADRAVVIDQVIAAMRLIACNEDGTFVGDLCNVSIDGRPVNEMQFGAFGVSDVHLRSVIGTHLDRVRDGAGISEDPDRRPSHSLSSDQDKRPSVKY